jgi:hypothetical protein
LSIRYADNLFSEEGKSKLHKHLRKIPKILKGSSKDIRKATLETCSSLPSMNEEMNDYAFLLCPQKKDGNDHITIPKKILKKA